MLQMELIGLHDRAEKEMRYELKVRTAFLSVQVLIGAF